MSRMTDYSPALLQRVRGTKKWEATAWHEAGHAVVWIRSGYAVRSVHLTPGHPKHKGLCKTYPLRGELAELGPTHWPAKRVRAELLCNLAGMEAERLITGRRNHDGSSQDYKWAFELEPVDVPGLGRTTTWASFGA